MDSSGIVDATPEALLALYAGVSNLPCDVRGNLPREHAPRAMFVESGVLSDSDHNWKDVKQTGILKSAYGDMVEPEMAGDAVDFALSSFGMPGELSGSFRAIIECMDNTLDHSVPERLRGRRVPTWHLHVHYDRSRDVVCFSILDYGIGIIDGLTMRGALEKISSKIRGGHALVLRKAFAGEYGSRTGKGHRGLGLKGIRKLASQGEILRLVAIANRGYMDFTRQASHHMRTNFPGTLICWEVERAQVRPIPHEN